MPAIKLLTSPMKSTPGQSSSIQPLYIHFTCKRFLFCFYFSHEFARSVIQDCYTGVISMQWMHFYDHLLTSPSLILLAPHNFFVRYLSRGVSRQWCNSMLGPPRISDAAQYLGQCTRMSHLDIYSRTHLETRWQDLNSLI